jgi:transcriptional regulator with XRE-family HTH domain
MENFLDVTDLPGTAMTRFWEKLFARMEERGLIPAKLAGLSGVPKNKFTLWKKGALPGIDDAIKVARHLGVSLDYLADDYLDDPDGHVLSEEQQRLLAIAGEVGVRVAIELIVLAKRVTPEVMADRATLTNLHLDILDEWRNDVAKELERDERGVPRRRKSDHQDSE